jgi:hypothetical protein
MGKSYDINEGIAIAIHASPASVMARQLVKSSCFNGNIIAAGSLPLTLTLLFLALMRKLTKRKQLNL